MCALISVRESTRHELRRSGVAEPTFISLLFVRSVSLVASIVLALVLLTPVTSGAASSESKGRTAVLITGASSGIGRATAEHLAAAGYFVYAGVRKESDLRELNEVENVHAIHLDVTKPEDIAAAVNVISNGGRGLFGVVNNAGISSHGSAIHAGQEEFDLVMAVNVAGPFRISRAFAPMIIAQKGRIVNISSIMGVLSVKDMSIYCMSKHAIESFTDSLAEELEPLGVRVSVIEPGTYRTEITRNAFDREGKEMSDSLRAALSDLKDPKDVAAAIELALFEPNPKRRYLVVPDEDQHSAVIKKQIAQLVELNEGQPYTYDRKILIKLLDEALAGARPRTPNPR